jgi:hypothetical protein
MPMILATFCNNVIQRLKEEKSTEHFTAELCWNLFAQPLLLPHCTPLLLCLPDLVGDITTPSKRSP